MVQFFFNTTSCQTIHLQYKIYLLQPLPCSFAQDLQRFQGPNQYSLHIRQLQVHQFVIQLNYYQISLKWSQLSVIQLWYNQNVYLTLTDVMTNRRIIFLRLTATVPKSCILTKNKMAEASTVLVRKYFNGGINDQKTFNLDG